MTDRPVTDIHLKEKIYGRYIEPPHVDVARCTGCGRCAKVCPRHVFEIEAKRSVVIDGDSCIACGHCWGICPERAVTQCDSTLAEISDFSPDPLISSVDFLTFLRQRRSVRRFESRSIPREQLERVVDAGRYAPTASNRQNVEFIVLPTPERVDELRRRTEAFLQSTFKKLENPLVAKLVSWKRGRETLDSLREYAARLEYLLSLGRKSPYFPLPFGSALVLTHAPASDPFGGFNSIVALHSSALMAQSEGLGSCYLGFVITGVNNDKSLKAWLGIPKGHTCHSAMVLGYPEVKYRRPVERLQPKVRWL